MFELHLLESGISGNNNDEPALELDSFELHLLESGISGEVRENVELLGFHVWTPLTGIWYFGLRYR